MLILWMAYAVLVGLVVMGAAALFERGIRARRRWLWAGAQLAAVLVPLLRPALRRLGGASADLDVVFGPIVPAVRGALADLDALGAAAAASATLSDVQGPLVGAWIGASLVLVLVVLGGVLRIRKLRRAWRREVVDGSEVLVSDGLGPAVVGLLRPEIVLPAWALRLEARERTLILAHEEEHRRGGDPALLAAALSVPVLMPWNPAAWLAFARLREAVETDCDARVLDRAGRKPLHYARLLFDVSTRTAGAVPVGAGFGERASSLERRIRTMLGTTFRFGRKGLAVRLALAILLVVGACSLEVNINTRSDEDAAPDRPAVAPNSPEPAVPAEEARGERVAIPRPPTPVVATQTEESEEAERLRQPASDEIGEGPTFTPFTVAPSILNRAEVITAMEREFPPLLRDAGIGGTVKVYFLIGEDGTVRDVRLDQGSGHPALDDAALRVADVYRFSPALNRDVKVPVWVSFPITFQVR